MTAALERFHRRLDRNLQDVQAELGRTRYEREQTERKRAELLNDLDRSARQRFLGGCARGSALALDPLDDVMNKAEHRLAERLVVLRRAEDNLEQRLRNVRTRVRAVERLISRRDREQAAAERLLELTEIDEIAQLRHGALAQEEEKTQS